MDEYCTEEYARKLLNVKPHEKLPQRAEEYLRKIKSIPVKSHYDIIGYGSLMNKNDVYRTLPTHKGFRSGTLYGYERTFDCGCYGTHYMNIQPSEGEEISVAVMTIERKDLPAYILRESLYEVKEVDFVDYDGKRKKGLTVICEEDAYLWNFGEPMLNYVHLCITGILDINKRDGLEEILQTRVWYYGKYISLEEYLSKLDLVDYMYMNDYRSR